MNISTYRIPSDDELFDIAVRMGPSALAALRNRQDEDWKYE